jgi:excisionase family DNA binding protein
MDELVTVPEAARELGVSRWAVWQQVKAGHLPAIRVGRDWAIERAALNAFKAIYKPRRRSARHGK